MQPTPSSKIRFVFVFVVVSFTYSNFKIHLVEDMQSSHLGYVSFIYVLLTEFEQFLRMQNMLFLCINTTWGIFHFFLCLFYSLFVSLALLWNFYCHEWVHLCEMWHPSQKLSNTAREPINLNALQSIHPVLSLWNLSILCYLILYQLVIRRAGVLGVPLYDTWWQFTNFLAG